MASNGVPSGTPVSPNVLPRRPPSGTSAQSIAEQFCQQYYTVFSNFPRYLHRFYDQASVQNIVEVAENGTLREQTATNQKDIHEVILRSFDEARAHVDHISSQFSQNGGVMLQVTGTLFRKGRPDVAFVQSFFLAVQEKGFFVLNDFLRMSPMPGRRSHEVVHQPHTPKDGVPMGMSDYHADSGALRSMADPEQINQILAETKQVLSATSPGHPDGGSYSELLRRNSSKSTPTSQSPHGPMPPSDGENPMGHETSPISQMDHGSTGFLLNPRRRSANGTLPTLQRNSSVFVRDIPNNIEERSLREIFEQFGSVASVMIRTGKRDARFAFVDFTETSAMEAALAAELLVGGKRLLIEEKKPLVLRNKPRFTNPRANGDGSFGGSMDSPQGGQRMGHPFR